MAHTWSNVSPYAHCTLCGTSRFYYDMYHNLCNATISHPPPPAAAQDYPRQPQDYPVPVTAALPCFGRAAQHPEYKKAAWHSGRGNG